MNTSVIVISGINVTVDTDDVKRINERHWYLNKAQMRKYGRYYFYNDRTVNKKKETITLHRYIMRCVKGDGLSVDHINGDTLNCSKNNLRICTNAENIRNSKKPKDNTSGYKGVQFHKAAGKWMVGIKVQEKEIYLGLYTDKVEAATVYDVAALYYFKEYARLNFPKEYYEDINLEQYIQERLPKKTSRYTGVSAGKHNGWLATLAHNKVRYYLGTYKTEEEAHQAYLAKRKELGLDF